MRETIDQFMWGFQQHFRWHIGYEIGRALENIGVVVPEPEVILVGLTTTEENITHPICVEPETGPLQPANFAQVTDRAWELLRADPESEIIHSHPRVAEMRGRANFHNWRAIAIAEAIEQSGAFEHLTFFVSHSSPINGYEVHTCIGIPKDTLTGLSSFRESTVDRVHAGKSLLHEIIRECLHRADMALYLPDPGAGMSILGRTDDIVTTAADRFISGTMWRTTRRPSDLFATLNAVSSLTYERAGAHGSLTIANLDNLKKWLQVTFKNPVALRESRTIRKILQLTDSGMSILSDGQYAYGLGRTRAAPDIIEIAITGHARWEASVNGDKLVRVSYGQPSIPTHPIEIEEFKDIAERTIGDVNINGIWEIVQAVQQSGKGSTIVISSAPDEEALRLSNEGMSIDADYLEPDEIVRLSSVDGAIIVGPDSRCYAFGVILDGMAGERGDRARGSRFNSSVRYQNSQMPASMVVVISDDGTVDVLPRLMPRVRKAEVESAVNGFCEYCQSGSVDGEAFARLHSRVKRLEFYLHEEQCRRVNEAYEQEMDRRFAAGGFRLSERGLRPNSEMNSSYFSDL